MAQASSAQREPSMEEILASIRKIIEDGEMASKPGSSARGAVEPERAVERESATVLDVETFRGTRDVSDYQQPTEPEVPETVNDPYALAADISDVGYDDHHDEPVAEIPSVQHAPEPEPEAQLSAEEQAGSEPETIGEPEWQLSNFASLLDEELKRSPMLDSDDDGSSPRPAIMSDRTQRQVAASFGELSEAFAVSRQKSFDEMAEEMIRPMLQDWLDNNLPTLVERLVREEIERIARGPAA